MIQSHDRDRGSCKSPSRNSFRRRETRWIARSPHESAVGAGSEIEHDMLRRRKRMVAMLSIRKSLFGALVRLTMVPLSLPCVFTSCCCCSVALGSGETHCPSPSEVLVGGPQNPLLQTGVPSIDSNGLAEGTPEPPNRCCCCPATSNAKRLLVVRRSTQHRAKATRESRPLFHAGTILGGSNATGFRSSVSARAARCPTSAENCILLCRLLL